MDLNVFLLIFLPVAFVGLFAVAVILEYFSEKAWQERRHRQYPMGFDYEKYLSERKKQLNENHQIIKRITRELTDLKK